MNSIEISENKTLKLQNVISKTMDLSNDNPSSFDLEINKMNTYIMTQGAKQIGPLIQYSGIDMNEKNEMNFELKFMLQCDKYFHSSDKDYPMEPTVRVTDCLYARYKGPESKVKFAFDKIGVYAFENDIELQGSNYTIYVSKNVEEETMVADIFMPIKK